MARISERERKSGARRRRAVIYIVCEGAKTEVNYFLNYKTRYSNIDIRPIVSKHKSALHLVQRAEETLKREPYYPEDGDQIWCVFDRNGNSNEELREATQFASRKGYSIAYSNPSFELWFLLHFVDQRASLPDSDAVIAKLSTAGYIANYNKAGDYFDALLSKREQATKRAFALQKYHKENGLSLHSRESNPCTTVVQLVELLMDRAGAT